MVTILFLYFTVMVRITSTETQLSPGKYSYCLLAAQSGQNIPPEFLLSRSNAPILLHHAACTPFVSSVLNLLMTPTTHSMEDKWVPTYPCYPESPLSPPACGRTAPSFVPDPSQQDAAFSLTTMGSIWVCSSYHQKKSLT